MAVMPTVLLSGIRFFLSPPGSPLLQVLVGVGEEKGKTNLQGRKSKPRLTQAYPSEMQATGWDVPHTSSQCLQDSTMDPRYAGTVCVSCVSKKNELPRKLLEPVRRAHKTQSLQKVCLSLPWLPNLVKIHLVSPRAVDSKSAHPVYRV